MNRSFSYARFLSLFLVVTAPLCLTSCNLLGGLINTALSVGLQAGQVKLLFRCVPEGMPIDTPDGPVKIEDLTVGDIVIGYEGEPVRVMQKHEYLETDASERFMRITFDQNIEVRVCDMHRIGGRRAMQLQPGNTINGREVTAVDRYGGVSVSYDLLTEDAGYRIQDIPVNSMIEEMGAAMQRRSVNESDWTGRGR